MATDDVRDLIIGTPWGTVRPSRANPFPLAVDGRTAALRILRRYVASLVFFRPGSYDALTEKEGEPIPFKIPIEDILIEWPDYEVELKFPSVVFLGLGPGSYETIGLTSYIDEETLNKYGENTVLQWQYEYVETFAMDVWCTLRAERRSIRAGLDVALTPTEQMSGIRFRMPEYYDQPVVFALQDADLIEGEDSGRDRRVLRMRIEMRYTVVAPVQVNPLDVFLKTEVDVDEDTGLPVETSAIENP